MIMGHETTNPSQSRPQYAFVCFGDEDNYLDMFVNRALAEESWKISYSRSNCRIEFIEKDGQIEVWAAYDTNKNKIGYIRNREIKIVADHL